MTWECNVCESVSLPVEPHVITHFILELQENCIESHIYIYLIAEESVKNCIKKIREFFDRFFCNQIRLNYIIYVFELQDD